MDLIEKLKELDEWANSVEGKASIKKIVQEMHQEAQTAAELEAISNLKYKDGQKVMIGDVFIDEYHEQEDDSRYGTTSYVYRINEDETIDVCFSSCSAWKSNNMSFSSERSRLIRRNGKLQSPFDGPIEVE